MDKRVYATLDEVDVILKKLKKRNLYKHYTILFCLSRLPIKYRALSRLTWEDLLKLTVNDTQLTEELVHIKNVQISNSKSKTWKSYNKVVLITSQHFNRVLKEIQEEMGLNHLLSINTRTFKNKIIIEGDKTLQYVHNDKELYKSKKVNRYVYVLTHTHRNENAQKYLTDKKIGKTDNPKERKRSLTLGPVEIVYLRLWEVQVDKVEVVEKFLQSRFKENHIIGEWYEDPDNKLLSKVDEEINLIKLLGIDIKPVSLPLKADRREAVTTLLGTRNDP